MRDTYASPPHADRSSAAKRQKGKDTSILKQIFSKADSVDLPILTVVLVLLGFGLIMLFSASQARAYSAFGDSFWYVKRQFLWALLGGAAMFVFSRIDYKKLGKFAFAVLVVSLVLLVMVIIPGVGTTTNGATRWLFGFQPSELAKFAIILFFANSISKNQDKIQSFTQGFLPYLCVLGLFLVFLALEPHFSCIILITFTSMLLLFVGGARIKHFVMIAIPGVIGAVAMIIYEPYRLARVVSFLNPFADTQGSGWQIVQSLYSIGSGGLFGVGLGKSAQKLSSLPEPQNDFIFSVISEELGLFGAIVVIALFIFLIVRGIKIAAKAPDMFGSLLVIGIVGIIAFQALINIAVVTSSIPVTGMPLPFFSYGGTALAITMAEIGIVLNVSRHSKID